MFKSRWVKVLFILFISFAVLVSVVVGLVFSHQDKIVSETVARLNHDFKGRLNIGGSHISPFENFPYISIDLEDIEVYEGKEADSELLFNVSDAYVGFDIWTVISGDYEVKKIKLDSGFLKLVQHTDGTFNIANALSSEATGEPMESDESLHLDLQAIELINIDLLKLNEANNVLVEAFIESAQSSFKTVDDHIETFLDSRFLFNLILDNDTSFLHHKHVELHTTLELKHNMLELSPSELVIEKALFLMEGSVDLEDDMNLNLSFSGNKPNFDLLLAFIPEEIAPVFEAYDNGGQIYFDAFVRGKSMNGHAPQIEADFGCREAFIHNTSADRELNELFFKGHFTNGDLRDGSTTSLAIEDFSAKPGTGNFEGNVLVKNFESPDINVQLNSDLDLNFLAEFLNLENLEDVTGKVSLEMNFHDIIDVSQPEKSLEQLDESYYTKLVIEDVNFRSPDFPLPVTNLNVDAHMEGHEATVDQFDFNLGSSDVAIKASISDLPAILHHTSLPVEAILDIRSSLLDIRELTQFTEDSAGMNEQIKDLDLRLKFNSSARNFTESPNLPMGEFFVEELSAQFTNYPHRLHDFNVDFFIDSSNFRIIDFTGMIDESDFHFNGKLENYDLWFEEEPRGTTKIDFDLNSELIQLEDLFSYGGENYVPEDYRHEEFKKLHLHGLTTMEFNRKLTSTDIKIDRLEATMKVHPMRFEKFKGEFYIDSTHLEVRDFGGKLGNSKFNANLNYFLSEDQQSEPHTFRLTSERLDFDQLFAYNPPPPGKELTPKDHEAGFNIFEVPFSNMNFELDIDHLNYHRYLLDDFLLEGRMQTNHYVYVDTMTLNAAGGSVRLNGYFNGSNPDEIYFSPNLEVEQVNLDKLLFKFENFGQDHLVSENLHGKLTGDVKGKVHMHADMIPIIDDSELFLNFQVFNGSLNNFDAFDALSSYFSDKNLDNIRFDTLTNRLHLKNGVLEIPSMNINSTLGYFEISGKQNVDQSMEYYVRIPLKVIAKAGLNKLFAKKNKDNSDQVDEIQYRDENKRTRFLNVKITGTPDDYDVSLGKDRS